MKMAVIVIIIIISLLLLFLVTLFCLVFLLVRTFFFHIGLAFALPFRNAVYSLSLDGKTLGRCSKKNCSDEGLTLKTMGFVVTSRWPFSAYQPVWFQIFAFLLRQRCGTPVSLQTTFSFPQQDNQMICSIFSPKIFKCFSADFLRSSVLTWLETEIYLERIFK